MLKTGLFICCTVCCCIVFAQSGDVTTAARDINIVPADSLLKINPAVKNQLSKLLVNQKPGGLRLLLTGTDSAVNIIGRWLAAKQQQHLYHVHTAALVSKYIGETEKNIDRVCSSAEAKNCVLLFDEADALLGKRSTTTEPADKYSNAATAYLLERLNHYKGSILITCKSNACIVTLTTQQYITVNGLAR